MKKMFRAAALVGSALFLLAAGEAPLSLDYLSTGHGGDLAFLDQIAPAPVEAALLVAVLEDPETAIGEPDLGLVLPEAGSLSQLVRAVQSVPDVAMTPELKCLATAVYFESKGEPLEGQLAVAQVILNRVADGRFGRDICAVVMAPRQFSFVRGGSLPNWRSAAQFATAEAIALIAVGDGWREIVPAATHFHATRVSPGWRLQRVATVGRHVFYR